MVSDEATRLAALRSYRILDTDPEAAFDDLALLASHVCGTPIALISLVDEDRQWFKSHVGLDVRETHRSLSFCAHAIQQEGMFVIPDATQDPRFRDNPFVRDEPHIRFYAGSPLVTPEGAALGTLCVVDHVPRSLTAEQRRALDALRRQVEAQLALRRNLADLQAALTERDRAEADQARLVKDLRHALDEVSRLTALMPYCSTCELNVVIPASPAAIPKVSEGVTHILQEKGWSDTDIMKVELALDEALANAIRHGCKGDASKQVQCVVTFGGADGLTIVVRDPGPGFDPGAVPNPLEGDNVLKGSGRGVFLINQLMDEVEFADGGREVQMRKRPEPAEAPGEGALP
jgi:anti-sigma regulatory factor (Ser/Thr protein kinase)